jgi:hypothetical protein
VVSREQAQTVHPLVLKAALQADPQPLPALVGVDLGAQGYAVVKVNRIVSRTAPDAAAAKQAREQLCPGVGQCGEPGLLRDAQGALQGKDHCAAGAATTPVARLATANR